MSRHRVRPHNFDLLLLRNVLSWTSLVYPSWDTARKPLDIISHTRISLRKLITFFILTAVNVCDLCHFTRSDSHMPFLGALNDCRVTLPKTVTHEARSFRDFDVYTRIIYTRII